MRWGGGGQERDSNKQGLSSRPEATTDLLCGLGYVDFPLKSVLLPSPIQALPQRYYLENGRLKPNLPATGQGMWLLGHLRRLSAGGLTSSQQAI